MLYLTKFLSSFSKMHISKYSTYLLYFLMELNSSWEAATFAATQELPSILWNPKFYHCVDKSPPLVPILSQIDPIHTIPSYLSEISKYSSTIKYSVVKNKIILHRKSNMEDFTCNFNNKNRFIPLQQWFLNCDPHVHCKKFTITAILCQYSSNPLCGCVGAKLMAGNHTHIWQQHFLPSSFWLSLEFYFHLSFTDGREVISLYLTCLWQFNPDAQYLCVSTL
jgi:hypothetical protein